MHTDAKIKGRMQEWKLESKLKGKRNINFIRGTPRGTEMVNARFGRKRPFSGKEKEVGFSAFKLIGLV